ncbi:MAG TPA: hypothetical protein VNR39_17950 [Pseudolabrys sp.]|nr:hypothetical protein [Pseudolabrys sp.]
MKTTHLPVQSMRLAAALALAGILALPAAAQPATSAAKSSAKSSARPGAARAAPPQSGPAQIVCTKLGCRPLPRGCQAQTQFTRDGDPTGYQIIVCP